MYDEPREVILNNKIIHNSLKLLEGEDKILNLSKTGNQNESDEKKYEFYLASKLLLLNDKRISKIANLDIYENLEELYLQRNYIKTIEGLKYLKNLQILNLNNNYIQKIENLSHLNYLHTLDLGDNIIENFEINNNLPLNLIHLYLFDNSFFNKLEILEIRSLCVIYLRLLVRLDGLVITDGEKFILMDPCNLKNKPHQKMLKTRLEYISKHYEDIKSERRSRLKELEITKVTENLNGQIPHVNKDDHSDNNQANKDIESINSIHKTNNLNISTKEIKLRCENRIKEFEKDSEDRMKELKAKLDRVRNNLLLDSNFKIDELRKENIRNKINKAIGLEEKIKKADEMQMRIDTYRPSSSTLTKDSDINTSTNTAQQENIKIKEEVKEILEEHEVAEVLEVQEVKEEESLLNSDSYSNYPDNSLLTDNSDLSFIKKLKNKLN